MVTSRLLVVEDDAALREVIARGLREEGFDVLTASDGRSALGHPPDSFAVILIDIGLPDADGRDVCQALRAHGVDTPVLFLTARDRLPDRLAGFAAGGDDYLVKPFHLSELVARLRTLIRRTPVRPPSSDTGVRLDPAAHSLSTTAGSLPLTPTEYRLLATLMAARGSVVRRRELVRAGWSAGARVHDNTLDQYLARLRRKLSAVHSPETITTARGVGYRYG